MSLERIVFGFAGGVGGWRGTGSGLGRMISATSRNIETGNLYRRTSPPSGINVQPMDARRRQTWSSKLQSG